MFDIDEAKRICDEATPGPWNHGEGISGPYLDFQAHPDERGGPNPLSDYSGREPLWLGGSVMPCDRAFCAYARTALPAAIEEIERLRATIERYQIVLGPLQKAGLLT